MAVLASFWAKASFSLAVLATTAQGQNITSDSHFYGQSPPVYPSPGMPGTLSWQTAHAKAVALVLRMTIEERANLTVGFGTQGTLCAGVTGAVPRIGLKGLCLADAGQGLRNTDHVNAYPAGISVGASWNRALTHQRGSHMAAEFKKKGVNVLLGPVVGGMGRVARGGRNWEAFSNDPYLCGKLGYDTISGIQSAGVVASVKHYIVNEQEDHRNPLIGGDATGGGAVGGVATSGGTADVGNPNNFTVESLSSNVDDKTMHELYLWPFAEAVHAGVGSVMCSYQRINNSYACHNSKAQNGLLKGELGFEGFIVTDWRALHTGVAAIEGGLDMAMPDGSIYWGRSGENVVKMVQNGSVEESRVTDMATRIVASWYQMGQDTSYPEIGLPANYVSPHKSVYARDPSSQPIVFQGAVEGHVLVKNVNKTLPLKKPRIVSVFGYDSMTPPVTSLVAAGSRFILGFMSNLNWDWLRSIRYPFEAPGQIAPNGTLIVGGGSGGTSPPYISAPWDALTERAYKDGTQIYGDALSTNPNVHYNSDACLVFINAFATEGADRPGLHDDYSDSIILNVASKCSNTIVVIHNAGVRLVDQWIDHPNITALIFAHLPGQDSGRALVSLLYGDESPSGKLPYTVAKNESDYNVDVKHPEGEFYRFPQDDFTEGVYIDYRDFDKKNITPRYEFGFGLTYTTFSFSALTTSFVFGANTSYNAPDSPIVEGGQQSLWDTIATVSAVITNTGDVIAKEVAQLYIHIPGGPVKQLRGFEKVEIAPGKSARVKFALQRRDLSEWSVVEQAWVLQSGSYEVWVGSSSRDLPLAGELTVDN
ncbi:hypothetical protein WAI453_005398 [Rhynchosporium graminicola]|uniref:beta-glucosidase n=1 Tax=Rhynchosporium graminicola TaxID=2792576 RepID=A0A1E1LS11_9HELO|nr:probable beta-glucosidase precursor [Rhynchosporium commune]